MSGLQEILIIVLVVVGIIFIPRIAGRNAISHQKTGNSRFFLSGPMRLALTASILWLAGAVIYYRPWESITMPFFTYGLAPVIGGWCLYWVWDGFKKRSYK